MIKAICAVNNKMFLGRDGKMMWRSSDDFKHFKEITMGGILIVGRKTFDIDLRGKGLPGRTTIVVGKGHHTLGEAVQKASILKHDFDEKTRIERDEDPLGNIPEEVPTIDIWVIGGKSIYDQMAPLVDELHLSRINDDQDGDTTFNPMIWGHCKVIDYHFETNK